MRMTPALALTLLVTAAAGLARSQTAQAVALPTATWPQDPDRDWKTYLRNHLAQNLNNSAAFDLPTVSGNLPGFLWTFQIQPGSGCTQAQVDEAVQQGWLLEGASRPLVEILHIPSEVFTLDYIEGVTQGSTPHGVNTLQSIVEPLTYNGAGAGYGFLWQWDYATCNATPGNPYYQAPGLLNRALAVLAVQLIQIDQMEKTRDNSNITRYSLANMMTGGTNYANEMIPTNCYINGPRGLQPPRYGESYGGNPPPNCTTAALQNDYNNNAALALALEDLGSEYLFIRPALTPELRKVLDFAFNRLGNRLAMWGPSNLHVNRVLPGSIALYLATLFGGDGQSKMDYQSYTKALIDPANGFYDASGHFSDDYGWDSSYNLLNFVHLGRLARLEETYGHSALNTLIWKDLYQMYLMRATLTGIDPGLGASISSPHGPGYTWMAPNPFNTRTPADTVNGGGQRIAMAFDAVSLDVPGAYPILDGWDPMNTSLLQNGGALNPFNGSMSSDINTGLNYPFFAANNQWKFTAAPYLGVQAWTPYVYGYEPPAWSVALNDPSMFATWDAAVTLDPTLTEYPSQKAGDSAYVLDNDFVFFKLGDLSGVIHTGPVSHYEDGAWTGLPEVSHLPAGYGGGALILLSTEDGGVVSQSRRKQRSISNTHQQETMDNWNRWERWSLHNVWLRNPVGDLFQSSRILDPWETVSISGSPTPTMVQVTTGGFIPQTNAHAGSALLNPVKYQRSFVATPNQLRVTTSVASQVQTGEPLLALEETIPLNGHGYLFEGVPYQQNGQSAEPITVTFLFQNNVLPPTDALANAETWFSDVIEVRYERLGGGLVVHFDQPSRVKLTDPNDFWWSYDSAWADGVRTNPNDPYSAPTMSMYKIRNIVVDHLGNAGTPNVTNLTYKTASYTLSPL